MPARNLGERKSFECDDDTGFDGQGYVLTNGNDGSDDDLHDYVRKTESSDDQVVGINYTSTYDEQDREILMGWRVPVIHDGYPNVLCAEGDKYEVGDAVYVSDTVDGIATLDDDTGSATKVGNVISQADLTEADGPTLVQVDITSNTGEQ